MCVTNIWVIKSISQKKNRTAANRRKQRDKHVSIQNEQWFVLTEVLDSVVALLVVHFDGLSMGTADAIADRVTAHHNVLVLWRRPAHHDAVDQWPDVERAGLVWYTGFWRGKCRKNFNPSETISLLNAEKDAPLSRKKTGKTNSKPTD